MDNPINGRSQNRLLFIGCGSSCLLTIIYLLLNHIGGSLLAGFLFLTTIFAIAAAIGIGRFGLYYLLFILVPFSQSIPIFSLGGREVNLGMHTLVIIFIIVVSLRNRTIKYLIPKSRPLILLFSLSAWTFLTIILSMRYVPTSGIANSIVTWIRWVQFMPIACLLYFGVGKVIDFEKLIRIAITIGVVIAIWGILETIFPTEFQLEYFRGAVTFTRPLFRELDLAEVLDPVTGFYKGSANYNIAGAFEVAITLMALPFLMKSGSILLKMVSRIIILLLVVGVAVTNSRSALVALIAGFLVYWGAVSLKKLVLCLSCLLTAGVALVALFPDFWLIPMLIDTWTNLPEAIPVALAQGGYSASSEFTSNVLGAALRFVGIREAISGFLQAPVFGWGFFGFSNFAPQIGTAENFYLQMLTETGGIGFILLILFLWSVWATTRTEFPIGSFAQKFQTGFRAAFISLIVVNLTGTLFYDQRIWGLLMILTGVQLYLVRCKQGLASMHGDV